MAVLSGKLKQTEALILSYLANLAGLLSVHLYLDTIMLVKIAVFFCVAACIGAEFARINRYSACRKAACYGAFFAICTLWIPVVLVSYGLALSVVPFFALYSLALSAGWRLKTHLQRD